ncbi:MAG TPA: hypothetical protein VMV10_09095, partial [Pirellulales bacterium]|nr:hypothetical protein [Pirellulales bacterium]
MPRLVAGFWLGRGLAQSKHLQLMLAFANRLHAPVQEARRLVAAGRLGRLYGVEMHLVADQTRLKSHDYHHSWFAHKDRAGGVPDPERLAPLVQTALSLDEKHELYQWALFSKALHDYRCGRFAEARTACRNGRERATADFAALSVIDRT